MSYLPKLMVDPTSTYPATFLGKEQSRKNHRYPLRSYTQGYMLQPPTGHILSVLKKITKHSCAYPSVPNENLVNLGPAGAVCERVVMPERKQKIIPTSNHPSSVIRHNIWHYFFFFFGFFLTPPLGVPCADSVVVDTGLVADAATSICVGVDSSSDGRRFCIFCIRERLRASNRLRNMDEYVLNLIHCSAQIRLVASIWSIKTHGGVVRDLEDKFALRWFPFYAVAGL